MGIIAYQQQGIKWKSSQERTKQTAELPQGLLAEQHMIRTFVVPWLDAFPCKPGPNARMPP
jgi:hypothetical protein